MKKASATTSSAGIKDLFTTVRYYYYYRGGDPP
jgi:hypothetical protein